MYDVPFDLTIDDIVIPAKCPVFGIALHRNSGPEAKIKLNSPTIDRTIPSKGYVRGNINIISNKANLMKGSRPMDELKMFAKWILAL